VEGALLLLVAFLSANAPNCHLSLVFASVVQDDAVNCNSCDPALLRNCVDHPADCNLFKTITLLNLH